MKTADLCDEHSDNLQIVRPELRNFGGKSSFYGKINTVRVYDDNVLVREAVSEPGNGGVLVVDGAASMNCALLGDLLAGLAEKNGWAGIIINGCIRDSDEIARIDIGVQALATMPIKSVKRGEGERNRVISFGGVVFRPGEYVYADNDGIVVSADALV